MQNNFIRLWLIGLALFGVEGLLAQPPAPRMHVWAVGDSFRIDPTKGKAFEANSLVFPDATRGNYRQSNLVWDGDRKRISLKVARNEIVSFQLVVERAANAPLARVDVKAGHLTGPGGVTLSEGSVELFKAWYVNITRRSA